MLLSMIIFSQQVSSESFLQSIGTKNSKSLNDFHFDDK